MNLAAVIEGHPADRPALIFNGVTATYGELRQRVGEVRRELDVVGARLVVVEPGGGTSLGDLGADAGAAVVDAVELLGAQPAEPVDRDAQDPAVLLFTSGTAGAPRAAVLTHGNLLANIEQIEASPGWTGSPDDVALGALPLFHVFGLNALLGVLLHTGGTVLLVDRVEPESTPGAIADHG